MRPHDTKRPDTKKRDARREKDGLGAAAAGPPGSPDPGEGGTFEEAFARAEKAVDALERGDLPLDDALRTYEDGIRGLKRCYDVLRGFERRIEVLGSELGSVAEGSDGPIWVPAERSAAMEEALEAVDRDGDLPDPTEGDDG